MQQDLTKLATYMLLCYPAILLSGSVCDNRSTDENWIPPLSGTFSGISGNREHAGPVRHDLSNWASDNTMGPKGRWRLQCAMTIPGDNDTSALTYIHGAARGDPSGGLDAYEGESSLLPDSVHGKEPMHPDKGKQQFLSRFFRLQKICSRLTWFILIHE